MGGVCILSGATRRKHGIITTMQNDLENTWLYALNLKFPFHSVAVTVKQI